MKEWHEDDNVWFALDELCDNVWINFRSFLDELYQYEQSLPAPIMAYLYGGLAKFIRVYGQSRELEIEPYEAFQHAIVEIQNDKRMQIFQQQAIETKVDNLTQKIKEE